MDKATQKSIRRKGVRNAIKLGLRKWMTSKSDMHALHKEKELNEKAKRLLESDCDPLASILYTFLQLAENRK